LRIQQISRNRLEIQQGSLYPALYRLEHQGLIESEWGESENKRKARFYRLTAAGRRHLQREARNWNRIGRHHCRHPRDADRGSMSALAAIRSWMQSIVHRSRVEQRMDDELRFHIESSRTISCAPVSHRPTRAASRASSSAASRRRWRRCATRRPPAARRARRRSPVCVAAAAAFACVHDGRDSLARARHRRQQRHLQPDGSGGLEADAGHEPERLALFSWVSGPRSLMNSSMGNWSRTVAGGAPARRFRTPSSTRSRVSRRSSRRCLRSGRSTASLP